MNLKLSACSYINSNISMEEETTFFLTTDLKLFIQKKKYKHFCYLCSSFIFFTPELARQHFALAVLKYF